MTKDEEQLNLLAIFHYVVAGLAGLFSLFPVLHLIMGLLLVLAPEEFNKGNGPPPPPWFGWIFVIMASVFIAMGLTCSALVLTAGRSLAKRKRYVFCLVVAGIECMFMPFGTILGVFTIVVLVRDSTKQLFANQQSTPSAHGSLVNP